MKILVANDDPISRRVLIALLTRHGCDVIAVSDGLAAWNVLSAPDAPRLAVLDGEMPGLDGAEICRRVRLLDQEPYTYILLLTGRKGRAEIVAGLDAGADDHLTKPFHESEMRARLRVGRRIVNLHADLVAAREAMRRAALHDVLTGVYNRAGINAELERELARAARTGDPLAVAMIDLDHFKRINDTWGHPAGDCVLQEAVRRIGGTLRPYDRLGRIGGEEFLVVFPGCTLEGARAAAERVRASVATTPIDADGEPIHVTTSVGLAFADPSSTPATLLRRADIALYAAKSGGRNRVREAA